MLILVDPREYTSRLRLTNTTGSTKNWDVVRVLEAKEYKYIPDLMNEIQRFWKSYSFVMKTRSSTSENHPANIQSTIAHAPPPETQIIASNKNLGFNKCVNNSLCHVFLSFTSGGSVGHVNIVWCWIAITHFPCYTRWHSLAVASTQISM